MRLGIKNVVMRLISRAVLRVQGVLKNWLCVLKAQGGGLAAPRQEGREGGNGGTCIAAALAAAPRHQPPILMPVQVIVQVQMQVLLPMQVPVQVPMFQFRCQRKCQRSSSNFSSLINRKNFLDPVTLVRSPTFTKLDSGVTTKGSSPERVRYF